VPNPIDGEGRSPAVEACLNVSMGICGRLKREDLVDDGGDIAVADELPELLAGGGRGQGSDIGGANQEGGGL
jgi:hypothetical protein